MVDFLRDLWAFAKERKKFWLVPLIGTLIILGAAVVITQVTAISPFIYTLF
jgi:hypothetical protein